MTNRAPSTLEMVQRLLTRFGAQDAAGIAQLFHPDAQCHSSEIPGDPWPVRSQGRREIEAFFLALFHRLEFHAVTVRKVLVDGDDAVVFGGGRYRATGTGRVFAQDFAVSLSVRAGLIQEYRVVEDTLAISMALGRAYPIY
ncbi:nuclear transport factor 2 family protein [Crossiella cryophila]|uniref:Ketosteroid isomerase-like protein n=1 Tax=Crossiella cryophila TaxID=43355 RepID=A0A7W7C4Z3_9PSEU|nr:nuclear transport factor 2 family protein [Crossiella cryophila]MBB4674580.1 ketosteroid isomerase-like protein [Crossiella cryophila]